MDDKQGDGRTLTQQANYWVTRRDAGLMTAQDEAALEAWLGTDPAHAQAYDRAGAIFNAVAALPGEVRYAPRRRACNRWTTTGRWPVQWVGGAIAASLAAILCIGADLPMRIQADAIAAVGESRRVALPDGSIALLDSDSAIAVDYGLERRISLLRGQATFTVAPDPAHPFVVEARNGTATALGTRFIVSRIASETRVTVTEHSVRVAQGETSEVVSEGQSAAYGDHGVGTPAPVHVADIDAWTRGRIRFVNRPLREVVAELGRYHRGYIGMVGEGLGNLPVNGVFSTRDPVGALDIIQQSLGLASFRIGDQLILLHS